jgi:hypothetical protein
MKPSLLLSTPDKWCRLVPAMCADGSEVSPFSKQAVKWDLNSAISLYTGLPIRQSELRIRATEAFSVWTEDNHKAECHEPLELWAFNDTTSFRWLQAALTQANL